MLAADKLLLESSVKKSAISLKEKEFNLHNGNFNTVGTQAAVIAGFTVTALIELRVDPSTPRWLQMAYYASTVASLSSTILCLASTTFLSVWGTSLAMRGPDGSMVRAVAGMFALRRRVFTYFGVGLSFLLLSAALCSWIMMSRETASVCTVVLLLAFAHVYRLGRNIFEQFHYDEREATNFDDLLRGRVQIGHPSPRHAAQPSWWSGRRSRSQPHSSPPSSVPSSPPQALRKETPQRTRQGTPRRQSPV